MTFVHRVNRAIRQREEIEKLDDLEKILDSYEVVSFLQLNSSINAPPHAKIRGI